MANKRSGCFTKQSSRHTTTQHKTRQPRALSIQPKIPDISVGTSNGTDHFGLVRPEFSRPALRVVHFDRSGHFSRSDRNVPFRLTKLLSPGSTALLYPAFKNNNQTRGGLGRVCATGMYSSIGQVEFPKFQTGIFVEWKVPIGPPNTTFVLNAFRVHFFKSNMVFFEGIIIHIWETAHLPLP